ncbi:protein kinase domain-containing protein [Streptomyces sp. NPDC002643]
MDEYAGRVLADRYRLPLPPSDEYEPAAETRAFDTYSGQEVLIRQVPLPEVVEAEVLGADGLPEGYVPRDGGARRGASRTTRRPTDPAVRRAVEAAQAAAQIPDHPRLDQVFDVFAEGGSLWIVSEWVSARTLQTLLEEQPLTPYRAAEVASDVLTALRALHAHGWVHRNITARTVLVCDDGRVMLTGLAVGAAEEALCGYDPVPVREGEFGGPGSPGDAEGPGSPGNAGGPGSAGVRGGGSGVPRGAVGPGRDGGPGGGSGMARGAGTGGGVVAPGGAVGRGGAGAVGALGASGAGGGVAGGARAGGGAVAGGTFGGAGAGTGTGAAGSGGVEDPEAARRAAIEARAGSATPVADASGGQRALESGGDVRAARAGAIAAYRAGARAAARVNVDQQTGGGRGLPVQRSAPGADRDGTVPSAAGGRGGELTSGRAGELVAGAAGELTSGSAGELTSGTAGALDQGAAGETAGDAAGEPAPGQARELTQDQAGELTVGSGPNTTPPGQIADPYGVRANGVSGGAWHGALPRGGATGAGDRAAVGAEAEGNEQGAQAGSGRPVLPAADDTGATGRGGGHGTGRGGSQGLPDGGAYGTRNDGSLGDGGPQGGGALGPGVRGGGATGSGSGGQFGVRALGSPHSPYGGGPYGRPSGTAGGRGGDDTFRLADARAEGAPGTQGAYGSRGGNGTPGSHGAQGDAHGTPGAPGPQDAYAQATPAHGTAVTPAHGAHFTPAHGHVVAPTPPHGGYTASAQAGAGAGGVSWDRGASGGGPRRGPATALAAERARQARMAVVGPVTERWAPEQAGPVHENWQLAAPIGPATDLWALGALLFRAVQGHAPYPEENTAELVQLVCSEPPAFAEECGPLRPVVESLLRQDPTERLDFEELRGWLRSLVRSAPEPDAGTHVVPAPPVDASRLPIVRRRGELVRMRRRRAGAKLPATSTHARHRRARPEKAQKPRSLGRNLLLVILLALVAAVAYALVFMPKAEPSTSDGGDTGTRTDTVAQPSTEPQASSEPRPDQNTGSPDGGGEGEGQASPSGSSGASEAENGNTEVAQGFTLRKDPEGFEVAVANGWSRSAKNGRGQIVYSQGRFELIIVPGRDSAQTYGDDPLTYQREDERELQPFRDSTWATSTGMRLIEVGGVTMAEGQFTWQDADGRGIFVRNLAILVDGRYHVVQLRGPEAERDEVTRLYEQASATYRVT